ncbi:hypothetical protein CKO36_04315 [Rhabdochromatium marinum]|nr:hypothetical protein [Rhabdochromatium marinum]MBK1647840.1 hypothetical protein [Rhabdochromatium marinum]
MSERQRKTFMAAFKAKVGLEGVRGLKTTNEIAQDYGVHPVQVGQWKKAIVEQASQVFEGRRGRKKASESSNPDWLYNKIGRLKMALWIG